MAWSDLPFAGKVRDKKAPYTINGDTIHSDAIRGGTTVKYWFDGDTNPASVYLTTEGYRI
jgi:hypothetical protein